MALERLVTEDSPAEWTIGTHIVIRNLGRMGKKVTNTYGVWSSYDTYREHLLGRIQWFSRWRKYVYEPSAGTLYEETCMREISEFIEQETRAHKILRQTEKEIVKSI
jgi:hypothetical protein